MRRHNYDLCSTGLHRLERRHSSSISNNRIVIIVAAVLVAGAVIAGIVVAVYFTNIPASQNKPAAVTRIEVTNVKTFQGEIRCAQDWNVDLNDPNSAVSKAKAYNFTSAMDAVYRNNSEYNGTVVDGFRNGSIVVIYRIYWVVTLIREIGKQGNVISEVESNPVDTAKLTKLIKDNLPQQIGSNVTHISELQEVTTSTETTRITTKSAHTEISVAASKDAATTTLTISTTLHSTTSTSLNPTTTSATTTKQPSIVTTTTPRTRQPAVSTLRSITASEPVTSITTTATTPKATTTNKTTSTTIEPTRTITITKEQTTHRTTSHSFVQPIISITTTTNAPQPITTDITTNINTPPSTIMLTTHKPVRAATTTILAITSTTTEEPTTSMTSIMHAPVTTPNPCKIYDLTVACQFEDTCICGYRNLRNDTRWYQRFGHFFKLPRYDHTYGNYTGQFMVAYNTSDLAEYYNMMSRSGPGYPYILEYSNSTLISPREYFQTESCVYFYYYLNGTAVRPNPLSAQLFVYVNSSSGINLAWYDHINRTVDGWLKGWVRVQPGHGNIIFEAKTVTTTTAWPGVVALDDVSVILRPCPSNPDCGPDTFQCMTTRVCIPVYMQCDGGNDCIDGSDEENCINKPDYQVKLINGDGSYGSIAIFYRGLWRPVCMAKYSLTAGGNKTVQLACKKVGYIGRYQGAFVNSWHQPVRYAMEASCSFHSDDISNCSMNLTRVNTFSCYYYQAAICSNDECFSGERLCPPDNNYSNSSSSKKCISSRYFCDGIPDCPGSTDEINCANCSKSEFECTNHECIPAYLHCDGTPQCGDKTDEYGCVLGSNNISKIYHSNMSAYLPICYTNMNDTLINTLCSLSGKGSSRHYQRFTHVLAGAVLTPQSNVALPSLVPGYTVSVEPCDSVSLQCTSTECGTAMFDDSRLAKILFGRDAILGQLPWQIALFGDGHFICGGSILHPNWVITATHCTVYIGSYSVRVGAVEVEMSNLEGYHGQLYNSSRIYNNPFYNNDYDNDISLLYFSQPIVFNNYVRPICIASSNDVDEMLKEGYNTECYVSGWGRYQNSINKGVWLGKLQMIRVYLYSKEECNQIYYDAYGSYPQNTTVCVDNQNLGSPACHGDSGGPLICRNKYGRFEMLGALSWGYNSCFKDGYPDIYQLFYPHADWIEETTRLHFSDLTMDLD